MKSYPSSESVKIEDVKPYWRNPRKISEQAVSAVKESLETFGYLQPIVVDKEKVIIIGHTRYSAMWRLGVSEVDVLVVDLSPEKAKQLRVVDNQTHVYSEWDYEKLLGELKEMSNDNFVMGIFPEASAAGILEKEYEVETKPANPAKADEVEFICPMCFHEWTRTLTKSQALSGHISVED